MAPNLTEQPHAANQAGARDDSTEAGRTFKSGFSPEREVEIKSRLDRQLGPEFISARSGPGGSKVHYIAGSVQIDLANNIFGFNGWSSEVLSIEVDYLDSDEAGKRFNLGISALVRITLRDGTIRENVGFGHSDNAKSKSDAFGKAKKEAVTDGTKRALKNFGQGLGLCIYDKSYLVNVSRIKSVPKVWDASRLYRANDEIITLPLKNEIETPNLKRKFDDARIVAEDDFDDFGAEDFDSDLDTSMVDVGNIATSGPNTEHNGYSKPPQVIQNAQLVHSRPPTTHPQSHLGPQHGNSSLTTSRPPAVGQGRPPYAPPTDNRPQSMPPTVVNPQQSMRPQPQPQPVPMLRHTAPPVNATNVGQPNNFNQSPLADAPVGFHSARAIQVKDEAPVIIPKNSQFNPHAQSPSIRKTGLVDHNSSKPIARTQINPAAGQNVVNPQLDTSRKVGMPYIQTMNQNRGAYKPPGPAIEIRTPLKEGTGNMVQPGEPDHETQKRRKAS